MDPLEWKQNLLFELFSSGKKEIFFFFLLIAILTGGSGVVSGDANLTTESSQGITVVDATGVLDVSQMGEIPLGQVPDERITIAITVVNNEKKDISGLRIRSFLVRNGREDIISMQLGSDFRDIQLKPGELKTFKNSFMVSKQVKPGDYKILVRVESDVNSPEKHLENTDFISNQIITIGKYAESGGSVPVYSPTKIETPGSYLLMRDIQAGNLNNIFRITTSGVTFDGGGHTIQGSSNGYNSGIYVDGGTSLTDITIKNCVIEGVDFGVWLYKIEGASIQNCTFRNCVNMGLRFDQTLKSSIVDNRFENNALGVGLFQSAGNSLSNNYFKNQFNAVVNEGQHNTWNTEPAPGLNIIGGSKKAGNVWLDLNGSGFSGTTPDLNGDGIVDAPFSINGANIDYYPLSAVINTESNVTESPVSSLAGSEEQNPNEDGEAQNETANQTPVDAAVSSPSSIEVPHVSGSEKADLAVLDINIPGSSCSGEEVPVSTTIGNIGDLTAETFSIHYYLSEDASITTSDQDIGSLQVESLMPQENKTYNGTIILPKGIPYKYHSLGVIIDPANNVFENNKQNNVQAASHRIQIKDCSSDT